MRGRVWMILFVAACASDPKPPKTEAPREPDPVGVALPPSSSSSPSSTDAGRRDCIVVQGEYAGQPSIVEGVLKAATSERGKGAAPAPLVLRLSHPRCIVGLARASFIAEVYIASTGTDLRPFIDTRVRITGDVVGGTTDMGGAAVVVLAKDVERIAPSPPTGTGD